jgi:response regulator RpfG family c-di-GMP phosphodiesterase
MEKLFLITHLKRNDKAPSSKLILVVEHNLDFGALLVQTIQRKTPHKAILATNGRRALNVIQHLQCDLFLLDYHLPSMNGFELYDRLHATKGCESIPALFLCGCTFLERYFTGSSNRLDPETFLRTIESLLDPESEGPYFSTPTVSL